jgi:hypothetical protein
MTNDDGDDKHEKPAIVPFAEFCARIRAVARGEAPVPDWAGKHVYASEQARQEWLNRMLETFDPTVHGGEEMPGRALGREAFADLGNEPLLKNWRLVAGVKMVGEVVGHPELADGWMLTSRLVAAPDPATRTARCESRLYRLGDPWPADRELPGEALALVMRAILLRLPAGDRTAGRDAARVLAQEAVRPGADPWGGFMRSEGGDDQT